MQWNINFKLFFDVEFVQCIKTIYNKKLIKNITKKYINILGLPMLLSLL